MGQQVRGGGGGGGGKVSGCGRWEGVFLCDGGEKVCVWGGAVARGGERKEWGRGGGGAKMGLQRGEGKCRGGGEEIGRRAKPGVGKRTSQKERGEKC